MSEIIEAYKQQQDNYNDFNLNKALHNKFKKVLEIYLKAHYPDGVDNPSLMCSIHNSFNNGGHNCVGCNLNVNSELLISFLIQYKEFRDINLAFTNFILLLYLLVERYNAYFNLLTLEESYRSKYFQIFQEIKWWANFLKHPKSFMLVHHPIYVYKTMKYNTEQEDFKQIEDAIKTESLIDTKFVKEYYSGPKNNSELYEKLSKKENFLVVFPDPVPLITKFVTAQKKFVSIIAENKTLRELLESEATIKTYFEEENKE